MKKTPLLILALLLLCSGLYAVDSQQVLHLEGSAYDIGYQHGSLLKDQIARNVDRFIDKNLPPNPTPAVIAQFLSVLPQVIPHIPAELIEEMHGLADGSGLPYEKIVLVNLFPEMFHCSGIATKGAATANGDLYHVRVLDYAAAATIQDTAVLLIVKPNNGHAFANVTYAGFVGSITGMNAQKISVGEIGGKGYGSWDGMPMAFLLRTILQHTSSIEEIKSLLKSTPRTCEYHYVFADGKTGDAIGVYATANVLQFIEPGDTYTLPNGTFQQPEECVAISGIERYPALLERLTSYYGKMDVAALKTIITQPVARCSNLHNAIFAPSTLEMWVSHAGPNNEPACDQPYCYYDLKKLFNNEP